MKTLARKLKLPAAAAALFLGIGLAWGEEPPIMQVSSCDSSTGACCQTPAVAGPDTCGSCDPDWYVEGNALFMHRTSDSHQKITISGVPIFAPSLVDRRQPDDVAAVTIFSAQNLHYNWDVGPKVTIGKFLDDDFALEFTYFGLYDQEANTSSSTIAGPFGILIPFHDKSQINDVEAGMRLRLNENMSLLGGFRYINFDDDLNASLLFTFVNTGIDFANANLRTENNLFGLQLGGDWKCPLTDRLSINLTGKGGIYYDHSNRKSTANLFGTPVVSSSTDGSQVAFVGEAGVIPSFQVTDHISLNAGYQLLWIEGVALAADQIPHFVGGIDTQGGVFMHGAIAGVKVTW